MTGPCPYNCNNKTSSGYCATTACINESYWSNFAQGTPSATIRVEDNPKYTISKVVDISDDSINKIIKSIREQPIQLITKDERKANWLKDDHGYYCSICGDHWDRSDKYIIQNFNYCPNCGHEIVYEIQE